MRPSLAYERMPVERQPGWETRYAAPMAAAEGLDLPPSRPSAQPKALVGRFTTSVTVSSLSRTATTSRVSRPRGIGSPGLHVCGPSRISVIHWPFSSSIRKVGMLLLSGAGRRRDPSLDRHPAGAPSGRRHLTWAAVRTMLWSPLRRDTRTETTDRGKREGLRSTRRDRNLQGSRTEARSCSGCEHFLAARVGRLPF